MTITAGAGDLAQGYEALRAQALGTVPTVKPRGLAVFMGAGLPAWMNALPPSAGRGGQQRNAPTTRPAAPMARAPNWCGSWPRWSWPAGGGACHEQRSPPQGDRQPPRALGLPVRPPEHAAPGVGEHREHQAPVRAAGRAIALGWPADRVVVIDSDLGLSGADSDREGFQRLVAAVGMGEVGVVLGLEVSRLARSSSDWHRLLEICALTDTLILDEDGIYNPAQFNDRLLLGLKGTMSEAELHVLRARLIGGQLAKASRGELEMRLPVGLVNDAAGHVVLDPDLGVQGAVRAFFETFARTGSATATVRGFREQGLLFPRRLPTGAHKGDVAWGSLHHSRALRVLKNPRYTGAFVYGRTQSRRFPAVGSSAASCPVNSGTPSSSVLIPVTSRGGTTKRTWPACTKTRRPMGPSGARAHPGKDLLCCRASSCAAAVGSA